MFLLYSHFRAKVRDLLHSQEHAAGKYPKHRFLDSKSCPLSTLPLGLNLSPYLPSSHLVSPFVCFLVPPYPQHPWFLPLSCPFSSETQHEMLSFFESLQEVGVLGCPCWPLSLSVGQLNRTVPLENFGVPGNIWLKSLLLRASFPRCIHPHLLSWNKDTLGEIHSQGLTPT